MVSKTVVSSISFAINFHFQMLFGLVLGRKMVSKMVVSSSFLQSFCFFMLFGLVLGTWPYCVKEIYHKQGQERSKRRKGMSENDQLAPKKIPESLPKISCWSRKIYQRVTPKQVDGPENFAREWPENNELSPKNMPEENARYKCSNYTKIMFKQILICHQFSKNYTKLVICPTECQKYTKCMPK